MMIKILLKTMMSALFNPVISFNSSKFQIKTCKLLPENFKLNKTLSFKAVQKLHNSFLDPLVRNSPSPPIIPSNLLQSPPPTKRLHNFRKSIQHVCIYADTQAFSATFAKCNQFSYCIFALSLFVIL